MPPRVVLLVLLAVPVMACTPAPYTVTQHGLIATPRPARFDGQPLPTRSRFEAHGGTARVTDLRGSPGSGAAVARHHAGAALRTAVNPQTDIGLELDGAWSATSTTLSGDSSISTGVPRAAVMDGALALRTSSAVGERMRLGFAFALGMSSSPIHREGTTAGSYSRDAALLARVAIVPSYRLDGVTLYASLGGATQAEIQETFLVVPDSNSSNDPGVVAEARSLVFTAAAGATFDLGDRVHLNAQLAQAFGADATFGPQMMAGMAIDLGAGARY